MTVWRKIYRRAAVVMTIAVATMLLAAPSALADVQDSVVSTRPVVVHQGEVLEDVVIVGNNATISGDVFEALIVLNGNVHLTSSARVGVLVDFGGTVEKAPGAHVNGEYIVSSHSPFWNDVIVGSSLVVAVWIARVVLSVALLALPVLLAVIFRTRLNRPSNIIARSVRRSGLAGLLVSVGVLVVSAALAATIVGTPVSAVILAAYAVLGVIGWSAVCLWSGHIIAQAFQQDQRATWAQTAVGATVLVAFVNVPIIGPVFLALMWMVGVGASTIWLWRK